jgi:glycerophosphoryl diester phosphodiesterase
MKNNSILLILFVVMPVWTLNAFEKLESSNISEQRCGLTHTLATLNTPHSNHVLVVAHRGGHKIAPENSLLSIKEAVQIGVDIVELDVRLTSDNILILMHDKTVDRTTTGTGLVSEFSFTELRKLNLKNLNGDVTKYMVPTLREALIEADNDIMVHIDLKDYSNNTIEIIAELIKSVGLEREVSFYHKQTDILNRVKRHLPLVYLMPMANNDQEAISLASRKFKMVHLKPHFMSKNLSKNINSLGTVSWVNALNEPDIEASKGNIDKAYGAFSDSNVDIIQTDEPELLINFLNSKQQRTCSPISNQR